MGEGRFNSLVGNADNIHIIRVTCCNLHTILGEVFLDICFLPTNDKYLMIEALPYVVHRNHLGGQDGGIRCVFLRNTHMTVVTLHRFLRLSVAVSGNAICLNRVLDFGHNLYIFSGLDNHFCGCRNQTAIFLFRTVYKLLALTRLLGIVTVYLTES